MMPNSVSSCTGSGAALRSRTCGMSGDNSLPVSASRRFLRSTIPTSESSETRPAGSWCRTPVSAGPRPGSIDMACFADRKEGS